uniref:MIF4G domain-containing protein n=1 Tax=Meloidogyne hapla TaxID=6305 RepID=A0A1I8B7L8_MELHA
MSNIKSSSHSPRPQTGNYQNNLKFRQKQQQVEEERLSNLLSSIGHLSAYGEVPVYAFSTLISTAPPQAIAEHLHQRWLSDQNFSLIAPKIVYQMSDNVTVCSQVLSFALRDFNTRHEIRKQSRGMFRNFVCTLVELYPVYRKIDKCLSACLIDPLFRCLKMLVSEDPDDRDLYCLANVIVNSGQQLCLLNNSECEKLIMACRRWLCSNIIQIEEETKRLLMIAIDLWTYSWDRNLFPDCLSRFYQQLKEEEKQKSNKKSSKLKSKEYPQPIQPPQILSDTVEYLSINKSTHCKSSSPFNKKNGAIKKLPKRPKQCCYNHGK